MTAQLDLLYEAEFGPAAIFSPCNRYRYRLSRKWGDPRDRCAWVMLNPSTADATIDDPTIRRCIAFSKAWGFGALDVVNLFAWRSTDPDALYSAAEPIGADNDEHIADVAQYAARVVVAWGNHGALRGRGAKVCAVLWVYDVKPLCFGLTKSGMPLHPLYQRADAKLIEVRA